MALALGPVVVLGPVRVVLVECPQLQEVEAEVAVLATMAALGLVVDLAQVQALASILKAHTMGMVGILTLVAMEVVAAGMEEMGRNGGRARHPCRPQPCWPGKRPPAWCTAPAVQQEGEQAREKCGGAAGMEAPVG